MGTAHNGGPMVTPATASQLLSDGLAELYKQGRYTPCQGLDGWLWTSEYAVDRRRAAKKCRDCPVITLCGIAARANSERWGVWGGRDHTRRRPGESSA